MSYRDTPAGEIRIWLDADYANSDRDELLEIVFSEKEKENFVDSWADKKASAIAKKNTAEFSAVKAAFKKQLCFTGKATE